SARAGIDGACGRGVRAGMGAAPLGMVAGRSRVTARLREGHTGAVFHRKRKRRMRHSTDRILVSHAGNLPRPLDLDELIDGGRNTERAGNTDFHMRLPAAVRWVVDRQIECGVDILNDGEYVKAGSFGGYISERVSGIESLPAGRPSNNAGVGDRD